MNEIKYLCSNIYREFNMDHDVKDLLEVARAFLQCKESEAEKTINKILKEDTCDKVKSFAQEILLSILFWQGRYSEVEKLSLLSEEKRSLVMSMMPFYHNPYCEVTGNDEQSIMNMPTILEELPAITATMNGIKVHLLFDTGSMATVLSYEVAKKCGVMIDYRQNTLKGQDATGKALHPLPAQMNCIKINGITIENKMCLLLSDEMLEFGVNEYGKARRIDGTIGWDIIKDFKWTIDSKEKNIKVEISKPDDKIKNLCCDFYPMVNVLYEDKSMCLGLDTGANSTVFRKSIASELTELERSKIEVYSAGGIIQEEGFVIPNLDLYVNKKLISIKNATVREQLHNNTNNFVLPGVLGFDICKNRKMVIDFPNRSFNLEE